MTVTSWTRDFESDRFDDWYDEPFHRFSAEGSLCADPSGWVQAESAAAELVPIVTPSRRDLSPYHIDEGDTLRDLKAPILSLLSAWEGVELPHSAVTLAHSVSAATILLLVVLRRRGIRKIIFETPAYGVTIKQAEHFGLKALLLPTYKADDFLLRLPSNTIEHHTPCALWVTQPRMSLGYNQDPTHLLALKNRLTQKDFLVVDEATEQNFPSHLSSIPDLPSAPNVVRLRGLLKGTGLNGLRLAAVIHDPRLRDDMEGAQEVLGGSLDIFSLQMAAHLAGNPLLFRAMLTAANDQTVKARRLLGSALAGTGMAPSRLINGYIGSIFLAIGSRKKQDVRRQILRFIYDMKVPLILGPSMCFARDNDWEQIRVNYFKPVDELIRGMRLLNEFMR